MESKKARILSIDGGGIRGVIPATIITYIEKTLIEKTKNPNARIADYFDLIAGTSTGGILACFYLSPNDYKGNASSKYTASEALDFYAAEGYGIFNKSKKKAWFGLRQLVNGTKYDSKRIEQIFLREFADVRMRDLLQKCLVTSYCMESSSENSGQKSKSAVFFNSDDLADKRDFYVRDVVRSTSAAPTYFAPAQIRNLASSEQLTNIDGGVFANNPSMCAYAEARKTSFQQVDFPGAKDMLMLSIGTGGGQFNLPPVQKSNKWGLINWAKSIPEIMMDGSIDTVNHQMLNLFSSLENESDRRNYKRIDVEVEDRKYASDMADASASNIKDLMLAGEKTLEKAQRKSDNELALDDFIDRLIENSPDNSQNLS